MSHLETTSFPYSYLNGAFIKTEDANVSIMTNALQYGTGVFGGIRGYYNSKENYLSLFRVDDHVKRFLESFHIIGVELNCTAQEVRDIILDLTKKNKPQTDTYYRPFGFASSTNLSPNLERDSVFDFALYMMPLGDYLPTDKGISVMISSWRRVADNAIPSRAKVSGSYINSALAKKQANENGYEEAIFLTEQGHVAEGSAMNLCIVRNGKLITPSLYEDVLEGITRRSIITLAQDLGIPVEERPVDRTELYICEEAFFCGTGAQISWISHIDKRTIGSGKCGPITTKLRNMFFQVVRGEEKKYEEWYTKIAV